MLVGGITPKGINFRYKKVILALKMRNFGSFMQKNA